MLAYVFWHRPKAGVSATEYEESLRSFHAALGSSSASFRLARLPFTKKTGYEDWYLAENWLGLGELNADAVDRVREHPHHRAASLMAAGWGGLYKLARGVAEIPDGTEWLDKPWGKLAEEFIASLPHSSVWRRQLVLGPAPELCCTVAESDTRTAI